MERRIPNYKCIQQQDGQTICLEQNCKQYAITCNNQQCGCHNKHKKCFTSTSYKKIVKQLFDKHDELIQPFNQIYNFIDRVIKSLTIYKQQIETKIQTKDVFTNEFQSQLYKILKLKQNVKQNGLTGNLCFKAVQSLKKNQSQHQNPEILRKKIKTQTSKYEIQIQNILKQMNIFFQKDQSLKLKICSPPILSIKQQKVISKFQKDYFKPSNNLRSSSIHCDQENKIYYNHGVGKSFLKFFSDPERQKIHFMLLQPGLDIVGLQEVSVEFQVLQKSQFYLGISFLQRAVSKQFIFESNDLQGYFYRNDGTSISSIYRQTNKYKIVSAQLGYNIILTYNGSRQTLKVKLGSHDFTLEAPRNSQKGLLYFAIGLAQKGSIKYLGVK